MPGLFLLDPGYDALVAVAAPVVIAGTVKDGAGLPLSRTVVVFNDNNLMVPLATVQSSPVTGGFSVSVGGFPTTKFTVIAMGSPTENNKVFSHCSEV